MLKNDKSEKRDISTAMLSNGISYDGFQKLLNDIKNCINESKDSINGYDALITEVRKKQSNNNTEEWIERLTKQVTESNGIIDDNLNSIEKLFERIFNDWNEYQKKSKTKSKTKTNSKSKSNTKKKPKKKKGDKND